MTASQHGRASTYNNYGCRCQRCRDAHADYQRQYRNSGKESPINAARRRAYRAAEAELRRRYPDEFAGIYATECDKAGLS